MSRHGTGSWTIAAIWNAVSHVAVALSVQVVLHNEEVVMKMHLFYPR